MNCQALGKRSVERAVRSRRTDYRHAATMWAWLPIALGATLAVYALVVLAFLIAGKRRDARAIAGFVPDCVVLFTRLMRDERSRDGTSSSSPR